MQWEAERDREGLDFVQSNIDFVRSYLISQEELSYNETEYINRVDPIVSVYMWGAGSGSFGWRWEMPNASVISVEYAGATDSIDETSLAFIRKN